MKAGFKILTMKDYVENTHYEDETELTNLIEMVPLVKDFDRVGDKRTIKELTKKYRKDQGIRITWHYYVIAATKEG
jgi:hypothetical protein